MTKVSNNTSTQSHREPQSLEASLDHFVNNPTGQGPPLASELSSGTDS